MGTGHGHLGISLQDWRINFQGRVYWILPCFHRGVHIHLPDPTMVVVALNAGVGFAEFHNKSPRGVIGSTDRLRSHIHGLSVASLPSRVKLAGSGQRIFWSLLLVRTLKFNFWPFRLEAALVVDCPRQAVDRMIRPGSMLNLQGSVFQSQVDRRVRRTFLLFQPKKEIDGACRVRA